MLFGKKKNKEEKARIKREEQQNKEFESELQDKIEAEQEKLEVSRQTLTKELRVEKTEESGFLLGLKKGLAKTKNFFVGSLLSMKAEDAIDDDFMEELEEKLLSSDLGINTVQKLIEHVEALQENLKIQTQGEAIEALQNAIEKILNINKEALPIAKNGPTVYLFVGVNGVGKTTSIGKLAKQFKDEGKKVLMAAGDTFRAAAIEQLDEWSKRAGVDIIKKELNTDPSATLYEACEAAVAGNYDVLLCDTSGRLHTKKNLMDELSKMNRTIKKIIPEAPHASLLVLDANTGQNAIRQTQEFGEIVDLTGLIITKLDGTAKGGVIIGIVNEFELPVFYIGVGEQVQDLQPFDPKGYAAGLFE